MQHMPRLELKPLQFLTQAALDEPQSDSNRHFLMEVVLIYLLYFSSCIPITYIHTTISGLKKPSQYGGSLKCQHDFYIDISAVCSHVFFAQ